MKKFIILPIIIYTTLYTSQIDFGNLESFKKNSNAESNHNIVINENIKNQSQKTLDEMPDRSSILVDKVVDYVQEIGQEMSQNSQTGATKCMAIKNEDLKNECVAIKNNMTSQCYSIKSDATKQNCLANIEKKDSYCFLIKNENLRQSCLASVHNDDSYCYAIKGYTDLTRSCVALSTNNDSICYGIINESMRYHCIALTK